MVARYWVTLIGLYLGPQQVGGWDAAKQPAGACVHVSSHINQWPPRQGPAQDCGAHLGLTINEGCESEQSPNACFVFYRRLWAT
jgi:hypothetical protein